MSLQSSADIVGKADPDRFAAAMAAPVEARRVLFPLYAFNVEVTRAPWVASEPMIGEMRLQWWRDALEEIAAGGPVRRHEVSLPLAEVLDAEGAALLDKLVEARRHDIHGEPFEDEAQFRSYLDLTGAGLTWVAARALGAGPGAEPPLRAWGYAAALARYLLAVPELEARGRQPLPDGRPEAVRALAGEALDTMPSLRSLPKEARPAVLEGWQARPLLSQARRAPGRVAAGTLGLSEFRKRASLLWLSL